MVEKKFSIAVKFTILGAPGVGKTSLRRNFMGENFQLSYQTTLGTDFANKKIQLKNGILNAQIWDLAGQMNYLSVTRAFLSHSNAALLVYDSTIPETFEHVKAWLKILHSSNVEKAGQIPFIILKNKVDLLDNTSSIVNKIDENDISEYARYLNSYETITEENVKMVPTSAKTGHNVEFAFTALSKIVMEIINSSVN